MKMITEESFPNGLLMLKQMLVFIPEYFIILFIKRRQLGWYIMITYHEYERLSAPDKNIYQKILSQVLDMKTTITISDSDADKVFSVYEKVLLDHPEIFWFQHAGSLKSVSSRLDRVVYLTPSLREGINASAVSFMRRQVERAVSVIVDYSKKLKGEYAKVLFVHDYIVDNTKYSFGVNCYDLYGCLVRGQAVCAGYAAAFQLIMNRL